LKSEGHTCKEGESEAVVKEGDSEYVVKEGEREYVVKSMGTIVAL
jgi:hypothetical protein